MKSTAEGLRPGVGQEPMTNSRFENVHALVADPYLQGRDDVESALKSLGVGTVSVAGSLDATLQMIDGELVDLLILATEWPDGDSSEAITAIRHAEVGKNPFMVIVVVAENADSHLSWRPLRYGADILMVPPLDEIVLGVRLQELVSSRNLFVATSDYVGPDRRAESGRETSIPLLEVPNSLADKVNGVFNVDALASATEAMMTEINAQKLERHAAQLVLLANRVGPDLLVRGTDEASRVFLEQMIWIAEDAEKRLEGSPQGNATDACKALISQVNWLDSKKGIPPSNEVGKMIQLANAVGPSILQTGKVRVTERQS
jgi:CheY-like chemotaxis protein